MESAYDQRSRQDEAGSDLSSEVEQNRIFHTEIAKFTKVWGFRVLARFSWLFGPWDVSSNAG
jgi:hypothetical protein